MIYLLDLFLAFLLCGVVLFTHPVFGIFVLLLSLFFGAQYWKTLLLMGDSERKLKPSKHIMAGTLAVIFTLFLGVILQVDFVAVAEKGLPEIWNDDLFPVFLALSLLCALLTATLATERRKR